MINSRLTQLIEELREKMDQPPHRANYDVHLILSNNRHLFTGVAGQDDLRVILADLETLSETKPVNYFTDSYRRETIQVHNRLRALLDRIL